MLKLLKAINVSVIPMMHNFLTLFTISKSLTIKLKSEFTNTNYFNITRVQAKAIIFIVM